MPKSKSEKTSSEGRWCLSDRPFGAARLGVSRAGLAGAVEDGEFERADAWVEAYFTAAAGGWAMFQRSDGGCYALTRAGSLCGNPRAEGLHVCHLHARYINRLEDA